MALAFGLRSSKIELMVDLFPGVRVLAASPRAEHSRAASWQLGAGRVVVVQDAARAVERRAQPADAASGICKLLLADFSRAFRSKYGQSPRAFRNEAALPGRES